MATAEQLGTDLDGVLDLNPSGREITGAECVAQAVARLIVAAPIGEGAGLADAQGESADAAELARMESRYRDLAFTDNRVADANVTCTYDTATRTLSVRVRGECADGPFRLVLSAGDAGVRVEEILHG